MYSPALVTLNKTLGDRETNMWILVNSIHLVLMQLDVVVPY